MDSTNTVLHWYISPIYKKLAGDVPVKNLTKWFDYMIINDITNCDYGDEIVWIAKLGNKIENHLVKNATKQSIPQIVYFRTSKIDSYFKKDGGKRVINDMFLKMSK
jgi:hypothetical protein